MCHEYRKLPSEKIGTDIFTLNNSDYLVIADYYSKWLEFKKFNGKIAADVIKVLKEIFSVHGIPKVIVSDNMPFGSYQFEQFAESWNFQIRTISALYPKSEEGNTDIMLEYRNIPVAGTNTSPAELLMSRQLRTFLVPQRETFLKPKVQKQCAVQFNQLQEKEKKYYDRTSQQGNDFTPNQKVFIENKENKTQEPATIEKRASTPRSYVVKTFIEEI